MSLRGPLIDLGGFRALIHGHDVTRTASIGFSWEASAEISADQAASRQPVTSLELDARIAWNAVNGRAFLSAIAFDEVLADTRFSFEATALASGLQPEDAGEARLRLNPNSRLKAWLAHGIDEEQTVAAKRYRVDLETQIDMMTERVGEARVTHYAALEVFDRIRAQLADFDRGRSRSADQATRTEGRLIELLRQGLTAEAELAKEELEAHLAQMSRMESQLDSLTQSARSAEESLHMTEQDMREAEHRLSAITDQLNRVVSLEREQTQQLIEVGDLALARLDFDLDGVFPRYVPTVPTTPEEAERARVGRVVSEELERLVLQLRQSLNMVRYLGPFRQAPRRFEIGKASAEAYVGADGELTAGLLEDLPWVSDSLNAWLQRMEIPYSIQTRQISDREYPSLGDLRTLELTDIRTRTAVSTTDVGFGISQVLPVVVQSILGGPSHQVVVVEQPEVHLHPRLQTELGDLFIETCLNGGQVIAETHSENLILRIQRRVREGIIAPEMVSVLYVGATEGQGSWIQTLPLGQRGEFLNEWPDGFFEERYEEWGES
jgi:hypothetical protein